MITISLCMIVKNEESNIGKCLESVRKAVDEIVIVDTGSTDRTKEIVSQYTDKIFDFIWINDFAAARNFSFAQATKNFILWLDADDILLPEDVEKLIILKNELSGRHDIDSVRFYYNYAFSAEGEPILVFKRERLVRRSKKFRWVGFIHEYIEVIGKSMDRDIYVTHTRVHGNADRNLNIYREKIKEGCQLSVRDQCYYAKELYYHKLYDEAIQQFELFLTMPGWIEDCIDACVKLSDCYIIKNEYKKARKVLFSMFNEVVPRAELLYQIAWSFQQEGRYEQAIYWYQIISHTEKPKDTAGFIYDELWTWRPHLEACVCYWKIGLIDQAIEQNELASKYVPKHESVLHNRAFFESLRN